MGIRFYCPNGHKLNVKTFLAGKRGICPQCGARMNIPQQSTRSSRRKAKKADALATAQAAPEISESPTPGGLPPIGPADALSQSAEVAWYVRPPSGGQFGPATLDLMRTWLAEGRIGPDTMVWHEGWRQWREASSVFPFLSPETPQLSIPGLEDVWQQPIDVPGESVVQYHSPPPSKTRTKLIIAMIVTIFSAAIIALIVLMNL